MKIILFFLLVYSIHLIIAEKIIYLNYTLFVNEYGVVVKLGNPVDYKTYYFEMEKNYTWASFTYYSRNRTTTAKSIKTIPLYIGPYHKIFELLQDELSFPNIEQSFIIPNFTFYYLKTYVPIFDSISLSRTFYDINTSLVHSLYDHRLIDKLKFGYHSFNFTDGLIYFGGIPADVINGKYSIKYNVDKTMSTWSPHIDKIMIGDREYVNKYPAFIQSKERRILIPKEIQKFVNETYFLKYMKNKTCSYSSGYGYNFFVCKCSITNYLKSFKFVIMNKIIEIDMQYLMRDLKSGDCQILFEENFIDPDMFTLGMPFLQTFVSVFNYEDDTITFYSDKEFPFYQDDNGIYITLIFNFCICFFGVVIIVLFKIKKYIY